MASDVLAVVDATTFKRPLWAGNVIATVQITTPVKVCTIRSTEFGAPPPGYHRGRESEGRRRPEQLQAKFVSLKVLKSERPELTAAARVVTGGRGVKGPDGFKLIESSPTRSALPSVPAVPPAMRAGSPTTAGRTNRQDDRPGPLHRRRHLWRHPTPGGHEELQGDRRHQQRPRAPILPDSPTTAGLPDLFKAVPELIATLKKGLSA